MMFRMKVGGPSGLLAGNAGLSLVEMMFAIAILSVALV